MSSLSPTESSSLPSRAEMFRNRLQKNLRRLVPWVARRGLEAYRIYDCDIPEVRLIVERYGDSLVVWEYARRADQSLYVGDEPGDSEQTMARERFLDEVIDTLSRACAVERSAIFVKRRQRQLHRTAAVSQYERLSTTHVERVVREGGHRFIVNLSDYLDTGLFLDHRETRAFFGGLAAGRRVLNLFGYTGSFSVYAAGGGARTTVTVDLSNTYLEWAGRNFKINGLSRDHRLLRADALEFLRTPPRLPEADADGRFDLIVLDPPTFSNSKKMRETLDVSRDHPRLIAQALRLLSFSPGSALLFSCNQRGFTLRPQDLKVLTDLKDLPDLNIRDLSLETLPQDFHNPRTRCCYLITR